MQQIETVKELARRLDIEFAISSNYYKEEKRINLISFSFHGGPRLEKIFREKLKNVGVLHYKESNDFFLTEILPKMELMPGEQWCRYAFTNDEVIEDFPEDHRQKFNDCVIQEVLPFLEEVFFEYYPENRNSKFMEIYENNASLFFNLIGDN